MYVCLKLYFTVFLSVQAAQKLIAPGGINEVVSNLNCQYYPFVHMSNWLEQTYTSIVCFNRDNQHVGQRPNKRSQDTSEGSQDDKQNEKEEKDIYTTHNCVGFSDFPIISAFNFLVHYSLIWPLFKLKLVTTSRHVARGCKQTLLHFKGHKPKSLKPLT